MEISVREFGAAGDGAALDSPAIQSAMDRCGACGGGTVVVPAGAYRCGTLSLRSNVRLHLDAGATILGIQDASAYPVIATTRNLPGQIQALLWAEGVGNVAVTGKGVIDGGGKGSLTGAEARGVPFRPALAFFRDCRQVALSDVTLRDSCFWTLHLLRCEQVAIRGLTIRANRRRINTDGIDPDGCRNVAIADCDIDTGDDCIVLKSTEGDDCENVIVANCKLRTSCAAMKIGTESLGAIRNVTMSACEVRDTPVGIALYMKDGGTYENIRFSNVVVEATGAFGIVVDNTPRYCTEPRAGVIRNVTFEKIALTGPGRCYVEGLPDRPVENLTLRDIDWTITGPCNARRCEKPAGAARGRRDPARVNYAANPYHFVIAHARGVNVSAVRFGAGASHGASPHAGADRGLAWLKNVRECVLDDVRGLSVPEGLEPIHAEDCRDIVIGKGMSNGSHDHLRIP